MAAGEFQSPPPLTDKSNGVDVFNAITKVRFNAAKPQRVRLRKGEDFCCQLLCLEAGQEVTASGPCGYYVIAGLGAVRHGAESRPLSIGSFASCEDGESHVLANGSEQRLICLAVTPHAQSS